ncbi:MAG: DNA-3-methyladenine glycosylase 2 family protein [Clostridia bacterium]|nr:DNA-3-methyladenine glycosylase 2 family protein [Clostridia bacterium]
MIAVSKTCPRQIAVTDCGTHISVSGCAPFDAAKTFDCGQTFLIEPSVQPDTGVLFCGTAGGKPLSLRQTGPDSFDLFGVSPDEFHTFWRHYFDLDSDYAAANEEILRRTPKESRSVIQQAVLCGTGIRLLRQDPWETLVSFIVSQNNNIPRIKKILHTLYAVENRFPTPETLLTIGTAGLYELKCGFRAKYLTDAAEKVLSGTVDFTRIAQCASYPDCAAELEKIKGVGKKVSACILLFGFHKTEAFPVDTWMQKVIQRHFGGHLDTTVYGQYAGLAQQYLFYYERWTTAPHLPSSSN